jgi:hypothetical protein
MRRFGLVTCVYALIWAWGMAGCVAEAVVPVDPADDDDGGDPNSKFSTPPASASLAPRDAGWRCSSKPACGGSRARTRAVSSWTPTLSGIQIRFQR